MGLLSEYKMGDYVVTFGNMGYGENGYLPKYSVNVSRKEANGEIKLGYLVVDLSHKKVSGAIVVDELSDLCEIKGELKEELVKGKNSCIPLIKNEGRPLKEILSSHMSTKWTRSYNPTL